MFTDIGLCYFSTLEGEVSISNCEWAATGGPRVLNSVSQASGGMAERRDGMNVRAGR